MEFQSVNQRVINRKLKQFRQQLNLSQEQFAAQLGIKQGSYSDIERGKVQVSNHIMQKLVKQFNLNPSWYYSDEGEMFRTKPVSDHVWAKKNQWGVVENSMAVSFLSDEKRLRAVPLIQQKAFASFIEGFADEEFISQQPVIYLPNLPPGELTAFEIAGDSMEPNLLEGDILLTSRVISFSELRENRVYVFAGNNGLFVKRLFLSKNENSDIPQLHLHSDNPEHRPFVLSVEQVQHVWKPERRITACI
jgi:transcriptional regulator with XRE-family HTH domain